MMVAYIRNHDRVLVHEEHLPWSYTCPYKPDTYCGEDCPLFNIRDRKGGYTVQLMCAPQKHIIKILCGK
jgi:hypothetical protein